MTILAASGERVTSVCDLPNEIDARRIVDLCRMIPTVLAASAEPLDTKPKLAA